MIQPLRLVAAAAIFGLLHLMPQPVLAGAAEAPAAAEAEPPPTAEELAERAERRACKLEVCRAFHGKETAGADVACKIIKSWRKNQVEKLVAKLKVSWPYGPVRCNSDVKLNRAELVGALSKPKQEMTLQTHSVTCTIDRGTEQPTDITFEFAPTVTFENGKATKAQMNWGKIDAPALIKSGLWTATAADNSVNVLSGTLVEEINTFVTKKCDEVKEQMAGGK